MNPKLIGLKPVFLDRLIPAIDRMNSDDRLKALKIKCILPVEGLRTLTVQMAYGSRLLASWVAPEHKDEAVKFIQEYYKAAGLYTPEYTEALTPCTWTLKSKHFDGMACDLAPSLDGTTYWWKAPEEVWKIMCLIGNSYGLECGLNWISEKKDPGHYELKR